jgi:hypothetical protein
MQASAKKMFRTSKNICYQGIDKGVAEKGWGGGVYYHTVCDVIVVQSEFSHQLRQQLVCVKGEMGREKEREFSN